MGATTQRAGAAAAAAFLAAVSLFGRGAEAVSNGKYHSCSVFDDGTVKCAIHCRFRSRLGLSVGWFRHRHPALV